MFDPVFNKLIEKIDSIDAINAEECCRLFHGRGQLHSGLAHVNVDWFPPVVLISIYQKISEDLLMSLANELMRVIPQCQSVQVQHRYLSKSPFTLLSGNVINQLTTLENNLKYHINLGQSQNVGLFLDMSNGRRWVNENADGKKVLNLFSFTCAFSVAAIAGGAKHVLNIDNNNGVLNRGRDNHRLNDVELRSVSFAKLDIFRSFSRIKKYGPYDLLICDPPSFQQGSVNIKRDYAKIIRRIPQFMVAGGVIMLCLNAPELNESFLHDLVALECVDCSFVEKIEPPVVFEEAIEGKGLKVLIFNYHPSNKKPIRNKNHENTA